MPQEQSQTSFYRLTAVDTAKNPQILHAALRNGQIALFSLSGEEAQVMYLLPAPHAADIPRVVSERVISVEEARLLPAAPTLRAARLLPGHSWTAMDRGIVAVILGLELGLVHDHVHDHPAGA